MKWLILVLGVLCNASASVLVKVAVTPPRGLPPWNDPLAWLSNLALVAGVLLYGAAFLLYAAALARLPLNVAHPILTAGAIGLVALCSAFVFHEPFHPTKLLGFAFVIVGVTLLAQHVH